MEAFKDYHLYIGQEFLAYGIKGKLSGVDYSDQGTDFKKMISESKLFKKKEENQEELWKELDRLCFYESGHNTFNHEIAKSEFHITITRKP